MNLLEECQKLKDEELEAALKFLAEREKHNLAKLLAHLAEYDRRQLCVKRGHSTLFFYCVQALGYDEGGAFRRIRAARVARKWPEVLEMIQQGMLHLTALIVLHPLLTDQNRKDLFRAASGKTRRQLEAMVAEKMPQGPHADFVRRVPVAGGWTISPSSPPGVIEAVSPLESGTPPASASVFAAADAPASPEIKAPRPWEWQAIMPIAMDRVRIGFDAGTAVMRMIDRARQILRHKYPEGRLEDVVKEALEVLLDRKDPQRKLTLKTAAVVRDAPEGALPDERPRFLRARAGGRYVPAWVKSAVWARDGGRCSWRDADGTLCGSKDWIQYDHIRPFAKGGRSDTPRNIRLVCRAHNADLARTEKLAELPPPVVFTAPAASS